jgi:hypothetical protein
MEVIHILFYIQHLCTMIFIRLLVNGSRAFAVCQHKDSNSIILKAQSACPTTIQQSILRVRYMYI